MKSRSRTAAATDVAIVGMAGRFPGADDVDAFWRNVAQGIESVSFFTADELVAAGVPASLVGDPSYVPASALLEGIDLFDAELFGMTPREAEIVDPQQRLFLECAWTALEDAGYDPEQYAGAIGVYGGAGVNMYGFNVQIGQELLRTAGRMQAVIANDKDFLTTRVAYKLNLRGPSVTIQTACSTSLVAVHVAAHAVQTRQCDMALAGGCSIGLEQHQGYLYQDGGVLSPDGHCRAFDAKGRGFICGSGVGVVVLKRLADALADGDHVYAVIKGSAVNNDGSGKIGFTAPSVEGQTLAITSALSRARVDPATIAYVEAHGTATVLGDPVEIAALTQAYGAATAARQFCAIGSVKTNVGHLDAAAGVAGLIKTALALHHGQLPPSLHFERPNPEIDFAATPFYVNTALTPWPAGNRPRRAAVSSLGLGGTNAHVVLEQARDARRRAPRVTDRRQQLLVLSARTPGALESATRRLAEHLVGHPELECADVARTLQVGRRPLRHRRFVVATDLADAARRLESGDGVRTGTSAADGRAPSIVFLFPGGGAQHVDMGRELYAAEETFRAEVDACAAHLQPHLGEDIRDVLYPDAERRDEAARRLESATVGLPALFTVEYALAQLWRHWGIQPAAMIGHSLGEYVAACLAGVLSLPDALGLVALRGRLFDQLPEGAMTSIALPVDRVRSFLEPDVSIAAVNGPSACVASGPRLAITRLEQRLAAHGVECTRLKISVAAHSAMVERMLPPFAKAVRALVLRAPRMPYISNVTGTWITEAEATDPDYWAQHLRHTVQYGAGVETLIRSDCDVLLEVGPGHTLTSLARLCVGADHAVTAITSLGHPQNPEPADACMTTALGLLWTAGARVAWDRYARPGQRRVRLPTYPFERQRYWIDRSAPERRDGGRETSDAGDAIARNPDVREWFHVACWRRSAVAAARVALSSPLLVFSSAQSLDDRVVDTLRGAGREVVAVRAGERYERSGRYDYVIRPELAADYERLLSALRADHIAPAAVLHLWTIPESESFEQAQQRGYYSLLFLAQALDRARAADLLLLVVSSGLFDVSGDEGCRPEQATLLGPCHVIPQEYLNVTCRVVDIGRTAGGSANAARLVEQLCAEIDRPAAEWAVAYRGSARLVHGYQRLHLDGDAARPQGLRTRGTYLITGGLGNVALQIAERLAHTVGARLALVTRSTFPAESDWAAYSERDAAADPLVRLVRRVRQLQTDGAEVMVVTADVADEIAMRSALDAVRDRFGALHGIFHTAGVTKGDSVLAPISAIGPAQSEEQFRAKVYGLQVLDALVAGEPLDFGLLFSSNASVLGGLGLAAYSAANHFMDAFAAAQAARGGRPWISASWDGWPSTDGYDQPFTPSIEAFAMTGDESWQAIEALVAHRPLGHVSVSAGDLTRRQALWVGRRAAAPSQAAEAEARHPRPNLRAPFAPPETDVERAIVDVWRTVFGFAEIGIHDNFFELGGNSLVATQVISRLRESLSRQIPLRLLFLHPTASALGAAIAALDGTAPAPADVIGKAAPLSLEEVLGPVDRLSDEQVDLALAELVDAEGGAFHSREETK